jgi:hypothetical protein
VQVSYDGNKTIPGNYISLKKSGEDRYLTTAPVKIGSKFKLEIKNSAECYIYVFGKETDGSGYTLFPYPRKDDPSKTKYSPFCGITGYRMFPKDKSMTPDSIGQRDMIGVVVTSEELDWYGIQTKVNAMPKTQPFETKIAAALGKSRPGGMIMNTSTKGNIQFTANLQPGQAVWCFVELDKK